MTAIVKTDLDRYVGGLKLLAELLRDTTSHLVPGDHGFGSGKFPVAVSISLHPRVRAVLRRALAVTSEPPALERWSSDDYTDLGLSPGRDYTDVTVCLARVWVRMTAYRADVEAVMGGEVR